MKIEIITTPNDLLRETGFGTQKACIAFMTSLLKFGHDAVITVCHNQGDLNAIVKRKPELVVLAMKYMPLKNGGRIWFSEYFTTHNINYTGSQKASLLYDSDKVSAKKKIASHGIATAEFFVTKPDEFETESDLPLPLPLFIKPLNAANGNGVDRNSIAHTFIQYKNKVKALHAKFKTPVLVEVFLTGREFTIALIETDDQLMASPLEVIAPDEDGFKFLGAKVKSQNTEVLKRISLFDIHSDASDLAKKVFVALGARDFARIDIKMDQNKKMHFIEINLVPGMTKGSSYFPQSCEIETGLKYHEVVGLMIQGGIARCQSKADKTITGTCDPIHGPPKELDTKIVSLF
ncbi:MAG TPA: D-alanine--D-alanine ligase [Rhizobiales bacterium]|nr:D-alanine--D-alanine ligase [Hyphomicrobiales bacterium]